MCFISLFQENHLSPLKSLNSKIKQILFWDFADFRDAIISENLKQKAGILPGENLDDKKEEGKPRQI